MGLLQNLVHPNTTKFDKNPEKGKIEYLQCLAHNV